MVKVKKLAAAKYLLKDGRISENTVWDQEKGIVFYEAEDYYLYIPFPVKIPFIPKESVKKEQIPNDLDLELLRKHAQLVNDALCKMQLRKWCLNGNILSMCWTQSKYDKICETSYAKFYALQIKRIPK